MVKKFLNKNLLKFIYQSKCKVIEAEDKVEKEKSFRAEKFRNLKYLAQKNDAFDRSSV